MLLKNRENYTKEFVRNNIYNRKSDINAIFGGQTQSGIITPRGENVIFLITSPINKKVGYEDKWDGSIFKYFGSGQKGDMKLSSVNKALATHSENGKTLMLFEQCKGGLRFIDEMVCCGINTVQNKDIDNKERKAYVFDLIRADDIENDIGGYNSDDESPTDINEARKKAYDAAESPVSHQNTNEHDYKRALVIVRKRNNVIKEYISMRANGVCEGCGSPAPFQRRNGAPYLEAHHLHKLSDNGLDSPCNIIALCPNCHRRVHYGCDGDEFNNKLIGVIKQKEQAKKSQII